jgi:hypothetical protein
MTHCTMRAFRMAHRALPQPVLFRSVCRKS